jgi:uroporphyrinogen-III synthase
MSQHLQNKVFISTRPKGASGELNSLLTDLGATLLEFPLIEIKALALTDEEEKTFLELEKFQWMVLTSSNGVSYFFEMLQKVKGNSKLPEELQIAVIGEKTKKTLEKFGYRAAFINPGSTAEDFSEPFARHIKTTGTKPKILLPLGNLARTVIQDHLSEWADCTRIDIYQTEMPEKMDPEVVDRIEKDKYDMIIFTSPSGIYNFLKLFPGLSTQKIRLACIGEITARAARESGYHPLAVAQNSSSSGIVESILNYYISKNIKKT